LVSFFSPSERKLGRNRGKEGKRERIPPPFFSGIPEERKKGKYSSFPSFLSLSSGRKITREERTPYVIRLSGMGESAGDVVFFLFCGSHPSLENFPEGQKVAFISFRNGETIMPEAQ